MEGDRDKQNKETMKNKFKVLGVIIYSGTEEEKGSNLCYHANNGTVNVNDSNGNSNDDHSNITTARMEFAQLPRQNERTNATVPKGTNSCPRGYKRKYQEVVAEFSSSSSSISSRKEPKRKIERR